MTTEHSHIPTYEILKTLEDSRRDAVLAFHDEYAYLMHLAKGSSHNHQAWEGGYIDHIGECLNIASRCYSALEQIRSPLPFTFASAAYVLYFHDIEKIFKYTTGEDIDKDEWYTRILPDRGIVFTAQELNALEYAHGEVHDHSKTERKMNELAAFCHSCDVLSARMWWDKGRGLA
jgi:hypothetical protein